MMSIVMIFRLIANSSKLAKWVLTHIRIVDTWAHQSRWRACKKEKGTLETRTKIKVWNVDTFLHVNFYTITNFYLVIHTYFVYSLLIKIGTTFCKRNERLCLYRSQCNACCWRLTFLSRWFLYWNENHLGKWIWNHHR